MERVPNREGEATTKGNVQGDTCLGLYQKG